MRKLFLLLLLLIGLQSIAQQNSKNSSGLPYKSRYGNDVIIKPDDITNQRGVKIAVAFNGWLYASFTTIDTTTDEGGITLMKSKDNGASWTTIIATAWPNTRYTSLDLTVAGTDTNNLRLFIAGIDETPTTGDYMLFINKINATTNAYLGAVYSLSTTERKIYDVAIATDYRFPAIGSNPYSVAIIYSVNDTYDSVNYVASLDSGATWNVRQKIAVTDHYFGKVSLAYGRSLTASNGRYYAAWQRNIVSDQDRLGHIYTSRSNTFIDGTWKSPYCLDTLNPGTSGIVGNPSIAVQYNNIDNDSNSCTALVLFDRDLSSGGTDYDILGYYNLQSHYYNSWKLLAVMNSSENDLQPNVAFDPGYDNFMAVYFDATNLRLPYVINYMNLATPSAWTNISSQYNDNSNLTDPYPRIAINPALDQAAHIWIANGTGHNGAAMFDAEYSELGIQKISQDAEDISVYPNPVTDNFTISLSSGSPDEIAIRMTDITGKMVYEQNVSVSKGANLINVNQGMLPSGIYIVNLQGAKINTNLKICVK